MDLAWPTIQTIKFLYFKTQFYIMFSLKPLVVSGFTSSYSAALKDLIFFIQSARSFLYLRSTPEVITASSGSISSICNGSFFLVSYSVFFSQALIFLLISWTLHLFSRVSFIHATRSALSNFAKYLK